MESPPTLSGDLVGQRLGKYELLALIAVGGTAEIYLARIGGEAGFEKYLVVKCLLEHLADDQEFVRMFLDEARLGAQLDHSNIVQTLELGEHHGRYYMVMEYLAGMSLAQMARKTQERGLAGGLIPTHLVLGMAAQACAGLHYAHERKIDGKQLNLVHRDVSPQNLVVSYEGVLKIVDFGIAKSDVREAHTRTGTIKGKFAYMSPEQCLAKPVDRRTDIFALGTLCHELLTGRRLFKRQNTYDTYQAIINGNVPTPSSINPALGRDVDEVIMRALAYDRGERYSTAQAFGEALLILLHQRGTSVGPGDVSRFFDDYFGDDIELHAQTMRELIEGGNARRKSDTSWDEDFGPGSARHPASRSMSEDLTSSAVESEETEGATAAAADADFEDDAGPTRIDFDPAARIAQMYDDALDEPSRIDPTGETVLRDPIVPDVRTPAGHAAKAPPARHGVIPAIRPMGAGPRPQPNAVNETESSLGVAFVDPNQMFDHNGDSIPRMPAIGASEPSGKVAEHPPYSAQSGQATTRPEGAREVESGDGGMSTLLGGQSAPSRPAARAQPGQQSMSPVQGTAPEHDTSPVQEMSAPQSAPQPYEQQGYPQMPMRPAAGATTDPNSPTGPDPLYPALEGPLPPAALQHAQQTQQQGPMPHRQDSGARHVGSAPKHVGSGPIHVGSGLYPTAHAPGGFATYPVAQPPAPSTPLWLYAAVFAICAGIGLGLTLLFS